jgi:Ca2+/Na+ antiporter
MSEGGQSARSDLWGGVGWAGFGLAIIAASWRMDRFESMGAQLYTMPGFVPGMLGGVLLLLGLVLMLRSWRRHLKHAETRVAEPLLNRRIGITLLLALVYAGLLIGRAPFWLVTALFVSACVAIFAPEGQAPRRRATVALLAGVLTSAIVTLVFQHVFLVRLP